MRSLVSALVAAFLVSNTAGAQKDSTAASVSTHSGRAWIVPIGVVISSTVDGEMREWALRTHSHSLDRFARVINPLGTAHVLVPALALFYVGSALSGQVTAEHAAIETAGAYAASDAVESILKPIIGRERPHVTGNSHRFRPFTGKGDWHSLPSAHVAHIASIATAISMETDSRVITTACDAVVALVGWDRIYEDQHWTSDVAATGVVSAFISRAAVGWLASRWRRR